MYFENEYVGPSIERQEGGGFSVKYACANGKAYIPDQPNPVPDILSDKEWSRVSDECKTYVRWLVKNSEEGGLVIFERKPYAFGTYTYGGSGRISREQLPKEVQAALRWAETLIDMQNNEEFIREKTYGSWKSPVRKFLGWLQRRMQ